MSMSDHPSEMDMGSPPPQSPPTAMTSTANTQEMDMEQDDDDMAAPPLPQAPLPRGAPPPPMMISRISTNQPPLPPGLPTTALPPALPTDKFPAPLKPQDVVIKSYNPKGKSISSRISYPHHFFFEFVDKMLTVNPGEQYVISPITKEKIPASSISSHTKYGKNRMK